MSTIEDFKNAPVGAIATHVGGGRAVKMDDVERRWRPLRGPDLDDKEMERLGFTLDPVTPTTAREALDPLPDPEPDWLDAPAVLAWSRWDDVRREKVWSKDDGCYKSIDGEIANWSDLCYVTPLYPKDES